MTWTTWLRHCGACVEVEADLTIMSQHGRGTLAPASGRLPQQVPREECPLWRVKAPRCGVTGEREGLPQHLIPHDDLAEHTPALDVA